MLLLWGRCLPCPILYMPRGLPRKITWTTFFNHFYDFSMGIDKVKRILNLFGVILVIPSYLVFSNFWS